MQKTMIQTARAQNTTTTITAISVPVISIIGGSAVIVGSMMISLSRMQMFPNCVPSLKCDSMVLWSFSLKAKLLVYSCAVSLVGTRELVQFWWN